MATVSQLADKFRVAGIRKQRVEERGTIKRQRQTLVCNQCQTSKLRSDKAKPCGSFIKRDGGTACSYDGVTRGNSKSITKDRLNRLKAMVQQLVDT